MLRVEVAALLLHKLQRVLTDRALVGLVAAGRGHPLEQVALVEVVEVELGYVHRALLLHLARQRPTAATARRLRLVARQDLVGWLREHEGHTPVDGHPEGVQVAFFEWQVLVVVLAEELVDLVDGAELEGADGTVALVGKVRHERLCGGLGHGELGDPVLQCGGRVRLVGDVLRGHRGLLCWMEAVGLPVPRGLAA